MQKDLNFGLQYWICSLIFILCLTWSSIVQGKEPSISNQAKRILRSATVPSSFGAGSVQAQWLKTIGI